jgi:leucyl-tRNA synthetase
MSKSRGNVINPDDIIANLGADTLRLYEMFIGPFDQSAAWSTNGIVGPRRFLEKVWRLCEKIVNLASETKGRTLSTDSQGSTLDNLDQILNKTIQKVSEDIETLGFNTAVSAMMIFINDAEKDLPNREQLEKFLKILAPFAPHIAEELWSELGNKGSIFLSSWPVVDTSALKKNIVNIAVQVNGKVRATFEYEFDGGEEEVVAKVVNLPEVKKWVGDNKIKRVIFVKNRLVNIVI